MKNVTIILTNAYPYSPPTEQFLHEEIDILKNRLEQLYILPTSHSAWVEKKNNVDQPNVTVKRLLRGNRSIEIIGSLSRAIFSKHFFKELILMFKHNSFNLSAIQNFLLSVINTIIISEKAMKEIKSFNIDIDSNIIIYSYWISYLANAGVSIKDKLLKAGYRHVIVVSRAHGASDVFKPRLFNDYMFGLMDLDNKLDRIYSISDAGKSYLESLGFRSGLIAVGRLGVRDNGLKLKADRNSIFTIVSCSAIGKIKRVDLIVEALGRIGNKQIQWFHFGDGVEMQYLKNIASEKLGSNIKYEFMGRVSNENIMNFYKNESPDLFINVSSLEGIPVSLMEAISFGIPIIATDVGGSGEICLDRTNGMLLSKDFKIEELVNSINYFINMTSENYNKFSVNARKVFIDNYNSEKNYNEFASDIISLIRNSGND